MNLKDIEVDTLCANEFQHLNLAIMVISIFFK